MTKAELPESVMEQPDVVQTGVERVRVAPLIVVTGAKSSAIPGAAAALTATPQ